MYYLWIQINQKDLIDFSIGLLVAILVWIYGLPAKRRNSHD